MSNFYRLINFILDNINILSHVHASLYPTFMVRPSVSWSVIGWSLPCLWLFSPQHSQQKCPNDLFFFIITAHTHTTIVNAYHALFYFFHLLPPPLTILLHFFFFKQTDTFIENLHLKLESEKKGEALGIRHHFCRLKSFYLSFCLPFFLSSVLSFPLSRSFFPCYTSSFYYIYISE